MVSIDDDDRHDCIAHGDNYYDDARIANHDDGIDCPSIGDLCYSSRPGGYYLPAAWILMLFAYSERQLNLHLKGYHFPCYLFYHRPQ